ncbi:MAG TPA: hypothetical protein ENL03_00545, partial [Phycisphaerae bacterium]|nr:hypothetical protein [Phycisphaerae bacterium]
MNDSASAAPVAATSDENSRAYLKPPISPEEMKAIDQEIGAGRDLILKLKKEMSLAVVGQTGLIDSLLVGLLSDGHV